MSGSQVSSFLSLRTSYDPIVHMTDNPPPGWPRQHWQHLPHRPLDTHRSELHRGCVMVLGSSERGLLCKRDYTTMEREMFLFEGKSQVLLSSDGIIYSVNNPFFRVEHQICM